MIRCRARPVAASANRSVPAAFFSDVTPDRRGAPALVQTTGAASDAPHIGSLPVRSAAGGPLPAGAVVPAPTIRPAGAVAEGRARSGVRMPLLFAFVSSPAPKRSGAQIQGTTSRIPDVPDDSGFAGAGYVLVYQKAASPAPGPRRSCTATAAPMSGARRRWSRSTTSTRSCPNSRTSLRRHEHRDRAREAWLCRHHHRHVLLGRAPDAARRDPPSFRAPQGMTSREV